MRVCVCVLLVWKRQSVFLCLAVCCFFYVFSSFLSRFFLPFFPSFFLYHRYGTTFRTLTPQPMRVVVSTGTASAQIIQTQIMPQAMLKQGTVFQFVQHLAMPFYHNFKHDHLPTTTTTIHWLIPLHKHLFFFVFDTESKQLNKHLDKRKPTSKLKTMSKIIYVKRISSKKKKTKRKQKITDQ